MKTRLRAAVLAAATVITAGLLSATTAPAQAEGDGATCMDPTVTGSVQKDSITDQYGHTLNFASFQQEGYTSASCPTSTTEYRYRVQVSYDGRTASTYQSDIQPVYRFTPTGWVRNGTRIVFPELRLAFSGYKAVTVTVTSGSKSIFSSTWCRSNEAAYDYVVQASEWVGYETVDGVPRSRINACP